MRCYGSIFYQKCENHYSTGSRKNPWLYICKENTQIYLETCDEVEAETHLTADN